MSLVMYHSYLEWHITGAPNPSSCPARRIRRLTPRTPRSAPEDMTVSSFMKRVSDVASDLADHGPVEGWREAPELPIDQVFVRLGAEHGVNPEDVREEVRDAAPTTQRVLRGCGAQHPPPACSMRM